MSSIFYDQILVSRNPFKAPEMTFGSFIASSAYVHHILNNKLNLTCVLIGRYDLLKDRRINDVNVNFFASSMYKSNRFHVAVRLFSNR